MYLNVHDTVVEIQCNRLFTLIKIHDLFTPILKCFNYESANETIQNIIKCASDVKLGELQFPNIFYHYLNNNVCTITNE